MSMHQLKTILGIPVNHGHVVHTRKDKKWHVKLFEEKRKDFYEF